MKLSDSIMSLGPAPPFHLKCAFCWLLYLSTARLKISGWTVLILVFFFYLGTADQISKVHFSLFFYE